MDLTRLTAGAMLVAAAIAACGDDYTSDAEPAPDAGAPADAAADAPVSSGANADAAVEAGVDSSADAGGECDRTKPFSAPERLAVNTDADEVGLRFSRDGAVAYFARGAAGTNRTQLFSATRAAGFGDGAILVGVNPPEDCCLNAFPTLSADGREMLFSSNADGGYRIWRVTRESETSDFADRAVVAGLPVNVYAPTLTPAGVYFHDVSSSAVLRATRAGAAFDTAGVVLEDAMFPLVTSDDLTMYFRRGGATVRVHRSTAADAWPKSGDALSELKGFVATWISDDECTIALQGKAPTTAPVNADVFLAKRPK